MRRQLGPGGTHMPRQLGPGGTQSQLPRHMGPPRPKIGGGGGGGGGGGRGDP